MRAAAIASRSKRAAMSGRSMLRGCRTLSAKTFRRCRCWARYTAFIPLSPMSDRTRYLLAISVPSAIRLGGGANSVLASISFCLFVGDDMAGRLWAKEASTPNCTGGPWRNRAARRADSAAHPMLEAENVSEVISLARVRGLGGQHSDQRAFGRMERELS